MAKVLQEEIVDTLSKVYLFHHVPSQFSEIDDKTLISVYMRLLCVYDYDNKFSSDDDGSHLQHIIRCLRPLGLGYLVKKTSELLVRKKASRIILALHDKNFSKYENNINQRVRMILKKEEIQAKKSSRRNITSSNIHPQGSSQEQEVLDEEGTVTRQETWLSSISKPDGFVLPLSPPPLPSSHAPQSVGGRVIPGGWQIPRTPLKTQSVEAVKPETNELPICPIPPPPSFVDSPCIPENKSNFALPSNSRLSSIILSPPGNFADEKGDSKCQFKLPLSPVEVCKNGRENHEHLPLKSNDAVDMKKADEILTSFNHTEESYVNLSKAQSNSLKSLPTTLPDNSKRRTFVIPPQNILNSDSQDVDEKTPCPEDNSTQDCLNDVHFNSVNYTPDSDTQEGDQPRVKERLRSLSYDLSFSDSQCSDNTESSSQPQLFDTDTSESVSNEDGSPRSVTCMSNVVSTFDSTFTVPFKKLEKENFKRRTYCIRNDQTVDCVNDEHLTPENINLNEVTYCSALKPISENSTLSPKEITRAENNSACLTGHESTVLPDEKKEIDNGMDGLSEQIIPTVNQTINKNEKSNLEVTVYEEDCENSECNNSFFYLLKGNTVLRKPLSKIPKGQDLPRTPPFGTNVVPANEKLSEHKVADVCSTPTSSRIDVNDSSACKSVNPSLAEKPENRKFILDSFRLSDNSFEIFPSKKGKTNEKFEIQTETKVNKKTDGAEMCSDLKGKGNIIDGSDSNVILEDSADEFDKKVPTKSKKVIEKSSTLIGRKGKDDVNVKENTIKSLQHLNEIKKVEDLSSNPHDTLETSNLQSLSSDDTKTRSRRRVTCRENKTAAIEEKTEDIPCANEKSKTRKARIPKANCTTSEVTSLDTGIELTEQEKTLTEEAKKKRTKTSKQDNNLKTKQINKTKVNDPSSELKGDLNINHSPILVEKQTIEESAITSAEKESKLPVVQNKCKVPARKTRSKNQMRNDASETEVNPSESGNLQTAKDLTKETTEKASLKLLQNNFGSVEGSNAIVAKTKRKEKVKVSKKTSVEFETCDSPSEGKKSLTKRTSRLKDKVSDDTKEAVEPTKPRVESIASTSVDCKLAKLNLVEDIAPKKSNLRRQPNFTDLPKLESETQKKGRNSSKRKTQEIPSNELEHDLETQKEALHIEPKVAHQTDSKFKFSYGKRDDSNGIYIEKPEKIPDLQSMITGKKKYSDKDKGTKTRKISSKEIIASFVEENKDPDFKENKSCVSTKKGGKKGLQTKTDLETKIDIFGDYEKNTSQGMIQDPVFKENKNGVSTKKGGKKGLQTKTDLETITEIIGVDKKNTSKGKIQDPIFKENNGVSTKKGGKKGLQTKTDLETITEIIGDDKKNTSKGKIQDPIFKENNGVSTKKGGKKGLQTKTDLETKTEIIGDDKKNTSKGKIQDPIFKENKSCVSTKKGGKKGLQTKTDLEAKNDVTGDVKENISQGRTPFSEILNVRPSRRCKAKTLTAISECLDDTN